MSRGELGTVAHGGTSATATPAANSAPRPSIVRVDAERYLTTIESSKLTGSYVDRARSRVTVGEWADRWLAGQAHLKPTTRERYAGIVRKHIRLRWGTTRLADVTHADVQSWVTSPSSAASPNPQPSAKSTACCHSS